jgi:hypothetical protein
MCEDPVSETNQAGGSMDDVEPCGHDPRRVGSGHGVGSRPVLIGPGSAGLSIKEGERTRRTKANDEMAQSY